MRWFTAEGERIRDKKQKMRSKKKAGQWFDKAFRMYRRAGDKKNVDIAGFRFQIVNEDKKYAVAVKGDNITLETAVKAKERAEGHGYKVFFVRQGDMKQLFTTVTAIRKLRRQDNGETV